ncbi:MAG: bifunctional phosphoribosylaminoimidazolecarboxamide formyltransferase/IMP cyclohydrolase [Acidimicrobiia bacterium]|nr:bifunctional phosphoribosylaminoimidazolecarboxamide formyltransferase/IMP cyclohydrolase [Acidimicrobiia bacterium]
MSGRLPVTRALVSVWDKTGVVELCRRLAGAGVELVSSGGTADALEADGLPVIRVAEVTGAPEMLGGRVKTLHPMIHGALLADLDDPAHRDDLENRGIEPIQLVISNLYPFAATVADPEVTVAAAIEKIDIGGPTMVRAAAKNHAHVAVVTSPRQYDEVADAVEAGGLTLEQRRDLARAAFFATAGYDAAIVAWMNRDQDLPSEMVLPFELYDGLRYGENPHQPAAVYRLSGRAPWWATAEYLQGKAMSFNNYADAEAAWSLVSAIEGPAAVVVKHTNPCGVGTGDTAAAAFEAAWDCDPLSAFGGIVAVNRVVDESTAALIARNFTEVVIAPGFDQDARDLLAAKASLRLIVATAPAGRDLDLRRLEDGMLAQTRDSIVEEEWRVVTKAQPSSDQMRDLRLAWVVAAHTKSNAVVVVTDGAAVGVGAGDQSRVGAAERAVVKAGKRAEGGVAASDAFFPFRDGFDVLADAGVRVVVQPGGSKRDDEVIAAADERNVAMVFTGHRHFRH